MGISLTSRDRSFLSKLASYGVLSSHQIEKIGFPGIRKTTILRRLRKLKRAGLIERTTGLPCGEYAWHVTQLGGSKVGDPESIGTVSKNTLEHAVSLSEVRIKLENQGAAHGWLPEHELKRQWGVQEKRKAREFTVVPDALFVALTQGTSRLVSLEVELHAKSRRLYRTLFEKYPRNVPIWKVWYIVPDPKIARVLLEVWKEMAPKGKEDWIVWSSLKDLEEQFEGARVYSLLGSLPISKWIQTNPNPDSAHLENTRNKTAQPRAQALSSGANLGVNNETKNSEQREVLSEDSKNLVNTPHGQHYGESEGVPVNTFGGEV